MKKKISGFRAVIPTAQESEAGVSKVQGLLGLQCELKASMGKLARAVSKLKITEGRGPRDRVQR